MVLTPDNLLEIFKNKPNSAVVEFAVTQSNLFTAQITGVGNDDLLEKITGLENEAQLNLRKRFSKTNKDLFARIHRPEDKVFSAKGGSRYYNLSPSLTKDLIERLNNVYKGFSLKAWIESIALQYFHIDPMGLIFMEVGNNETYPTYKASNTIFDYSLNGRELNYIIFTTKEKNQYRVVDSMFDYLVEFEGQSVRVIPEQTYPNYFGYVPALIISDILAPNTEMYTSPDHEIIKVANEYLRESSTKSVYKLKHAYPKAWQYQSTCNTCKGTGFDEADTCEVCNGSGFQVTKDTSETITLPIPTTDQPAIAPNVAGYVSPDIQGWNNMSEELTALENAMHSTYWGIKDRVKAIGVGSEKTATEIIDDMQPLNDRLFRFSKWAETIETFITDAIGLFYYGTNYKGCNINYGRRYALESPDAIWNKYDNARKNGSPISVLDEHLTEYYYSKYDNNSIELNKYLKLMKVEPFIHLTLTDAQKLVLNPDDYNKKVYYSEWLNTLTESEILLKTSQQLSEMLSQYTLTKVTII